jgi:glycerol-3-phosphate O-acyltransferase
MRTLAVAALTLFVALPVLGLLFRRTIQRLMNRTAAHAVLHYRARVDRFKLIGRPYVRERLLSDPVIAEAVREHVQESGKSEADVWRTVDGYVREIVPFFNIIAYYEIGFRVSFTR